MTAAAAKALVARRRPYWPPEAAWYLGPHGKAPILIKVVVAIRGSPLDPGRAWLPQKGLKNDGGEAFAGGDKNWRGGLPFRATNGQHLELPWRVGECANGEFLVHIISREASE